jgi:hypothetical protein
MTLSTSEIILLTTVATLGIAFVVTSKITPEEETPVIPAAPLPHPHPKNTIVIEEVFE